MTESTRKNLKKWATERIRIAHGKQLTLCSVSWVQPRMFLKSCRLAGNRNIIVVVTALLILLDCVYDLIK